jgi:hypothetical protein
MCTQKDLVAALAALKRSFKPNELAYLALTSKCESPIRDAFAFELQKLTSSASPIYSVAREWRPSTSSTERVDVVALKRGKQPTVFIEAKAFYTFDMFGGRKIPLRADVYAEICKDIASVKALVHQHKGSSGYLLLMATDPRPHPSVLTLNANRHPLIKYHDRIAKHWNSKKPTNNNYSQQVKDVFIKNSCIPGQFTSHLSVPAGAMFDFDVTVHLWLIEVKRLASTSRPICLA